MIETMETMRTMMLTMYSTMSGIFSQMEAMQLEREHDGSRVRLSRERRFVLPAARSVPEPGFQAGVEGSSSRRTARLCG